MLAGCSLYQSKRTTTKPAKWSILFGNKVWQSEILSDEIDGWYFISGICCSGLASKYLASGTRWVQLSSSSSEWGKYRACKAGSKSTRRG
jgi:hypothetical protein